MHWPDSIAVGGARTSMRRRRRWHGGVLMSGLGLLPRLGHATEAPVSGRSGAEITLWLIAILALVALSALCAWQAVRTHRLEQRLRQVRLQQRALSDLLDVWQWRSGVDHHITGLRPPRGASAARWSGKAIGRPLWELFESAVPEALRTRLEAGAPLVDVEVKIKGDAAADGGPRSSRLHATALTDGQGCFAGYVGVAREAQAAEPPAMAPGPALIDPAAAPPERWQAPPEPADESFMYTLSHDLRAPIRVVEGFARILKEDFGHSIDRIGNDHIDRVLGAAARMSSMIDALLGLSRLSAQPLERQPVNLSQLASYVAEDLRRQSPQRRVELHIEPDLQTLGDPTLLRMAIENLIGNAWKYTGKRSDAQIWFERKPDEARTVYTVRDNGAGFDMRFADRLFGAFQRLHSATEFQGTGVGLVSVRRIVRRHGGEIWAESSPGQGARFHFTLAPRQGGG